MKIFSGTDKGIIRAINQDDCKSGIYSDNSCWAVVCDGMGGANAGEVASTLASGIISERLISSYRENQGVQSIKNLLLSAINAANLLVFDSAAEDKSLEGMGTTTVVAVVQNGCAVIAHVGDSRAYILSNRSLTRITKDHSYVQQLVDNGMITPEQAESHPYKNIITRALGLEEHVEIDYNETMFDNDSMLLLCSDGLTNYVSEDTIRDVLIDEHIVDKAGKLIELANENGGGDNITAVVITA